ncbi:Ubiquinone biosynthesis protein coq9, mitochondrial [Sorochytrium milnesiophthora]
MLAQRLTAAALATRYARRCAYSTASGSAAVDETAPDQHSADNTRDALLSAALDLVPAYSFTQQALSEAAHDLGLSPIATGLADNGPRDVIELLMDRGISRVRERHAELTESQEIRSLGTTGLVRDLCRERLRFMTPYIEQWPDAAKILARPSNVPFAAHQLHRLADEIWHLAGDKSYDLNYYSKRALLSSMYLATELFMTQDKSADFARTFEFLDTRFAHSATVGKTVGFLQHNISWGLGNLRGIAASKGYIR